MTAPLHTTLMSFDMDRPLNKAHWFERNAEAHMHQQKWDEAEKNYTLAAEMMRKALEEVATTSMAAPIKMQAEKLEKMKEIIDIKRKEAKRNEIPRKDSGASFQPSSSSSRDPQPPDLVRNMPKESENHKNVVDQGTVTSHVKKINLTPPNSTAAQNTWQLVPANVIQMIQDRETDSLLQFLNIPVNTEDDLSASCMSRKQPKSKDAVIEEYKMRLTLMQTTAVTLMQALEDTELENKSLKLQVEELNGEVVTLNKRLGHYEDMQNYRPLYFGQKDDSPLEKFSGDMSASTLITQPESYFEFNQKDVESELHDATQDAKSLDERRRKITNHNAKGHRKYDINNTSVQYEDLDDALNTYSDSNSAGSSSQLRVASLAGLPPLTPVHFQLDDDDNIVTDVRGGRKS